MVKVQNKVNTVMFDPDHKSHIIINKEACAKCDDKPCLRMCPSQMFTLSGDGTEVINSHEGCFECGTCYVICPHLSWQYPKGGKGVIFREV